MELLRECVACRVTNSFLFALDEFNTSSLSPLGKPDGWFLAIGGVKLAIL